MDLIPHIKALGCRRDGYEASVVFATLGSFSRSYPAVRDSVPAARHDLAAFATEHGATDGQREAIVSAVSEAVSNAVMHAYRGTQGRIYVTAAVAGHDLWLLVADEGCGFETPSPTPGLGWGLALIAHASDDFVLAARAEGGTEARMRFAIGNSNSPAGGGR